MSITTQDMAASVDLSENTLFIGHSLINFDIPAMVESLVGSAGGTGQTDAQITNGAPLRWNWDNSADAEGVDAREVLPSGSYGAVVMTEAITLRSHVQWSDSVGNASNFYNLAVASNPDTQVYLYETWHDLRSGTGQPVEWDDYDHIPWRDRIDQDLSVWQGIVDGVNAQRADGAPPMALIPAGQAIGRLSDAIDAGSIAGLNSIDQLFSDTIHLNDTGKYFVALVHAGAIHGIDPREMPNQVGLDWGEQVTIPANLADALQDVAAEALEAYGFLGADAAPAPEPAPEPEPIVTPEPEPEPEPAPEPEPILAPQAAPESEPVLARDSAPAQASESVSVPESEPGPILMPARITEPALVPAPGVDEVPTSGSSAPDGTRVERPVAAGAENTWIDGSAGDEALVGNRRANILVGMGGEDTMTGGAGADSFVLTARAGTDPNVTITDWGRGDDQLVVDDQLLGIGARDIDVRKLTVEVFVALHDNGLVGYNARTGELRVDIDRDGERELIATIEGGAQLGLDDVLLF